MMQDTKRQNPPSSRSMDWGAWLFKLVVLLVLAVILAPIVIVVLTSFSGKTHMTWPITEFTLRWYGEVLKRPIWVKAFVNSLIIAALTSTLSLGLATPAAYAVSRRKSRGAMFIRSFISWPLLVPPVIVGISLLMVLSRAGLRGSYLAIAIGHTLWAAPLVFITMNAVFERFNPVYVAAARDLGANAFQTFFRITLPIVKSGLISAIFLGFVVSTQEFIIALFLYAPSTITLPVEIYTAIRYELSPGISAISVYMIGIVGAGLFVIDRVIGIERIGFTGKG